VHSTAFVNSTTLVANIDVTDSAVVSGFDIKVTNSDSRSGHGSDLFQVLAKSNNASCASPTPWAAVLNNGAYSGLAKTVRGRLITVLGQPVVMAVAGGGLGGNVEVFFLDAVTGQVLDGTWAQPHLSLVGAEPQFYSVLISDVNGDGVPDIVIGARNYGEAWVHLGQGGGAGTIGFSAAIPLTPPQPNSGLGAAIAAGDLNGDGINEVALSLVPTGSGKSFQPGRVFLFRWNGAGFSNYQTLTDPQNTGSSNYGSDVAIGDITGDGHADLVVGANDNNRVWVYAGSSLTNPFFLTGPNNSGFGYGLAIGNLAGSTSPYLGLLAITGRNIATGYIYGGPVTSTSVASSVIQPAALTFHLASLELGDINGDGIADILMGSPNIGCTGTAYLYRSSASGYQSQVFVGPPPSGNTVFYGSSASLVEGTKIILVGDMATTINGVANAGQIYVYVLP